MLLLLLLSFELSLLGQRQGNTRPVTKNLLNAHIAYSTGNVGSSGDFSR
jgi:hypothetical protein